MHNSFLASSLTCHNLQPENTYFYFSYSRNNPALSGSNSSPEEKQPRQAWLCVLCLRHQGFYLLHSCTDSESWG